MFLLESRYTSTASRRGSAKTQLSQLCGIPQATISSIENH